MFSTSEKTSPVHTVTAKAWPTSALLGTSSYTFGGTENWHTHPSPATWRPNAEASGHRARQG